MNVNEQLVYELYRAFARCDGEAMAACYAPDAVFRDPVFRELKGPQIGAMWRMLCARATDLDVTYSDVKADPVGGTAHWEARYTFSATGNKVHNVISARFEFRDGKIVRHVDSFNLWAWSRQALGLKGTLLGWLPPVQDAVHQQARAGLDAYMAKHPRLGLV